MRVAKTYEQLKLLENFPAMASYLRLDEVLERLEDDDFGLSSEGESDFEEEGVYGYMPEADHDLLPAIASDDIDGSGAASSAHPAGLFPGH